MFYISINRVNEKRPKKKIKRTKGSIKRILEFFSALYGTQNVVFIILISKREISLISMEVVNELKIRRKKTPNTQKKNFAVSVLAGFDVILSMILFIIIRWLNWSSHIHTIGQKKIILLPSYNTNRSKTKTK